MNSWARKCKRVIPVVLSILVLLSMAACASKEQESGEDNRSSQESSGQSETVIDMVTPVQYVYSCDTVTFAEYGDRVDVCDVAGRGIRSCPVCRTGVRGRYLIRSLCRR